jgi:murein DD-endopeptidase MepM/ murein hydrolase activator NlpD
MDFLNKKQIQLLHELLEQQGLDYAPLQEELLDHVCCAIEDEMATGNSFDEATKKVLDTFGKGEIDEIQTATIQSLNQKFNTMKKISLLALFTSILAITIVWGGIQDPPSIAPMEGYLKMTSPFGHRMHPILKVEKLHKGVDFKAPVGTPIIATSDGEVIAVEYKPNGYGKRIIIKHDDVYSTCYAQLSEFKVKKGDKVKIGQVIALSGNSGASTAPHLHYEVWKNGESVDPAAFYSME